MTPFHLFLEHRFIEKIPAPDGKIFQRCIISFIPIKDSSQEKILLQADSPEEAFALGKAIFPNLKGLAVCPAR